MTRFWRALFSVLFLASFVAAQAAPPAIPPGAPFTVAMSALNSYRPYNRSVADLGDSISQHNTINASSSWSGQYGNRYIAFGYLAWLRNITRQAFDFDGNSNFGVVGDTCPMVQARTAASITASPAATWFVMCGVNDRGAAALTLAQSQAAVASIVQQIIGANRIVVLMTPTNTGDSANTGNRMSATQLLINEAFRQWELQTYASTPGVIVVDTQQAYSDPISTIGDNIVGDTYDGLHPSGSGAYKLAVFLQPVANFLFSPRDMLPSINSDLYNATNNTVGCLNANPMVDGTSGTPGTGGSGNVATGWSGANSGDIGHTRTYSKVSTTSFNGVPYPGNKTKTWQQVVFAGLPTSTVDAQAMFQSSPSGLTIGDTIYAVGEWEMDASSAGIASVMYRIYNNSDFTIGGIDMHYSGSMLYYPTTAVSGVFRTPPVTLTATSMTIAVSVRLTSGVASAATLRFRALCLRKVAALEPANDNVAARLSAVG